MDNYAKQWSTATPGFLIFLIDQSSSMGQEWADGKTFAEFTADVINRTINELIATNAAGETVKNRVFISLIGYGGNSVTDLRSDYLSAYADTPLRINKFEKKVSDGDGGFVNMQVEMPIFLEPSATGITPMADAFSFAEKLIKKWIEVKNDNPVPVIINVSDGKPDTGKADLNDAEIASTIATANSIMNMETLDGNPLIFNVHIANSQNEIQFPSEQKDLGSDTFANFLFKISSRVPEVYKRAAKDLKLGDLKPGCKGFISNASPETLIKFINFGSSGGLYRVNF
jgi:hypothetical protein